MYKIFVFILILFIALVAMLFSEENGVFSASDDVHSPVNDVGDVLQRFVIDTLDTEVDTTFVLEYETVIYDSLFYEGDILHYFVDIDKILLIGNAQVIYSTATIIADSISINFETNQAVAQGRIIMEDRDQLMIGDTAFYDIETETGIILGGASRFDMGFYYGQEIRRVCTDVYDVDKGRFTTCDAKHPHFDIRAHTMRVYRDHMVVGRPIIFYANDFPIFALPFGAFSIRSGRRTGFIMPEPGFNQSDGMYFRNLAYFVVFSDYADIFFCLDVMEKTGLNYRTELLYLDRYRYNGRFDAIYKHRTVSHEAYVNDWHMFYRHNQRLPERATFDVHLDFASSRDVFENEFNVNRRLQESIRSTISYNKPMTSSSFSTTGSYSENLTVRGDDETKSRSIVLPSFRYSLNQRPIHEFIPGVPDDVRRGSHWWTNFNFRWSTAGTHTGTIRDSDDFSPSIEHIFYKNERDAQGNYLSQHHAGIRQEASVSWSYRALGWLNLSNSFNYHDAVMDRDRDGNVLVHGYSYNTNSSASFNIYGTRRFQNFPISAVRHVVRPSVGFRYNPDFSEKNNRFYNFGGIAPGAGRKSRVINMSLDQTWQFRLRADRTGHERRLDNLLSLNSSTRYDLEREVRPWDDISHSLNLNPGSYEMAGLRFGLSQRYSFIQKPYENFDISSWTMTTGFNLSGNALFYDYFPLEQNEFITRNLFVPDTLSVVNNVIRTLEDLERLAAPGNWSLSVDHFYNKNRRNGAERHDVRNAVNARLTQNWSISYNNYYNMVDRKLVDQGFTVTRDLHCWRITFTYRTFGTFWEYRILLFNIQLPESLRLQQRDRS